MALLNTHRLEEINHYVQTNRTQKPWWLGLYGVTEKAEGSFEFQGFKVGLDFGKLLSGFTSESRIEFVAWEWLLADADLDDIGKLRQVFRFETLDDARFCAQIRDACRKIAREHPELRLWVRRRLALLELKTSSVLNLSPETLGMAAQINIGVMGAQALLTRAPNEVATAAGKMLVQGLKAVGVLASQILCARPSECRFRANLMIAIKNGAQNGPLFAEPVSAANVQAAGQLWEGTPPSEEILAVVAESSSQTEFRGFWVPAYRPNQPSVPGAGLAYARCQGTAVFADDLPQLSGVNDNVAARWSNYVRENFSGGFFVSLPLKLDIDSSGPMAYAVVNVNIYPNNGDGRRAYHSQWLNLVQQQTAALLLEIYKAYMLLIYADDTGFVQTRFGSAVEKLNLTAGIEPQPPQLPPGEQTP